MRSCCSILTSKLIALPCRRDCCDPVERPSSVPRSPIGGGSARVARAAAVSPLIEAGNVYLPHPDYAPWIGDFIEECAAFPNGAHDDQVDAMTQALLRWNMIASEQIVYLNSRVQMSPI